MHYLGQKRSKSTSSVHLGLSLVRYDSVDFYNGLFNTNHNYVFVLMIICL